MLMAFRVAPSDELEGPAGSAAAEESSHTPGTERSVRTGIAPDAPGAPARPSDDGGLVGVTSTGGVNEGGAGKGSAVTEQRDAETFRRVGPRWTSRRPQLWRELVLMGSVYLAYSGIRNLAPDQAEAAQRNARAVLDFEKVLHIDIEKGLNHFVSNTPLIAYPAIYYYATLHLIMTAVTLVWLYRRRPTFYAPARAVLLVMTMAALIGYWLYPLAPPRLMTGGGYIDTAVKFELWGYTPSKAVVSLSNQYAAMPSMHFGWALWIGVVLIMVARTRVMRVVGVLYPLTTLTVIVVTGNHFLLDSIVAFLIAVAAVGVVQLWRTSYERWRPAASVAGVGRTEDVDAVETSAR